MKKYLGVKIISAEPMTLAEYSNKFNKVIPMTIGEDGYLVQYEDSYKSWSPKEVFEKAYKEVGDYSSLILDANTITGEWKVYDSGDCCDDCCDNTCESIN